MFSDESNVPGRFKPSKTKKKTVTRDSEIERNFQETIVEWEKTISTMIDRGVPDAICDRLLFLELDPEDEAETVTENRDWLYQMDYLERRRNLEDCPDWELGKLVMVMGEYQRLIERKINKPKALKSELAQELLEKGEVDIDGHHIKLWRGSTRDTVRLQEDWNKIKSYSALNGYTTRENPRVCFSGMFQIPRAEVAEYASQLGFHVQSTVNGKTNLFVFGTENVSPSKLAEVIEYRQQGSQIEIMDENAFLEMVMENLDL